MQVKERIAFHKPSITQADITAVVRCLRNGWLTMGQQTIDFENAFRRYIGVKNAVAVNSCTAALHLALEAIGLRQGDEVLVPAMTFTATAEVVCYFKARPVLVDIDPQTHTIDVRNVERKITKRTKAVMPVDYAGHPADYDAIQRVARRHKLFIIEDAAHALPAWYKGRRIGTIADMTCFSFYATKTLATGEGGMVTTDTKRWADRMRMMRLHGMEHDTWKRYAAQGSWYYEIEEAGFKYNSTDIASALGMSQLSRVESMWRKRKQIAKRYNSAFRRLDAVRVPEVKEHCESSWHLYVIKIEPKMLRINRDTFIRCLQRNGISPSVHFIPLYRHPFYRRRFGYRKKQFPHCEWVYERIISLSIYPLMKDKHIQHVIDVVKTLLKRYRR